MSLISISVNSSEDGYEQKKLQYINQVLEQKKGSYQISSYYSNGTKSIEYLTCDMYTSPFSSANSVPWQLRLKYSTGDSNIVDVWQEFADNKFVYQLPEPNLMQETEFKNTFYVSDLVVTNSSYLTNRNFDVYNSTGGSYKINTDRRLFVNESVVPVSMKRYLSQELGRKYANSLGYISQQESLIVFSEFDKIYQPTDPMSTILLVYCGGAVRTVVTEDRIIKANIGFFYRIDYSTFEANRINYT